MVRTAFCGVLACLVAGCSSMRQTSLGNFESGAGTWQASGEAKVAVVAQHASQGRRALKVDFPAADYPGVGIALNDADWSAYDALRLNVYNPEAKTLKLSLRIDDEQSTGYGTRFNLDAGLPVKPGESTLELPMCALWTGSMGSRGLDVSHLRELRLFMAHPAEPITLYLDDVRLVAHDVPAGWTTLTDFSTTTVAKYKLSTNTEGRIELDGLGRDYLNLMLKPEASYPGVTFMGFPPNWLGYDAVVIDLGCPQGKPTPGTVSIKLTAGDGTRQTFATGLKKGANRIRLNLGMAGSVSLGDVRELTVFTGKTSETQTLHVGGVSLEKVARADTVEVHAPGAQGDRVVLDFDGMKQVGRNTCFSAIVWVPTDAGRRVVRVNAPGRGPLSYGLAPALLADATAGATLETWAFFLDHGVWQFTSREVPLGAGPVLRVNFDNPAEFAH